MPMHPDFKKILESFKEEYGEEKGERIFWAWVRKHGYDETRSMAWNVGREQGELLAFNYIASIQPLDAEKRLAKVFIIDATVNKNKWMVTPEAKAKALESLIGLPLMGPPELGHKSTRVVGRIKDFEANGAVYGIAEITDPEAWEKIKRGEWRFTSPRIVAYDVDFSPTGLEIVRDFKFDHIAFVEDPAYAQLPAMPLPGEYCNFSQILTASLDRGRNVATELPRDELGKKGGEGLRKPEAKKEGKTVERFLWAGAIPPHDSPKAPKDRAWDGDAARDRVRAWAGGPDKEKIDWDKYARAFAWVDPEHRDDFGGYKLPHHDIVDGELKVVWRGVAAAMQALLGARGGVDIPREDRRAVYRHLARHYKQFGEEPPEFHAEVASVEGIEKIKKEREELKAEKERLEAEVAKWRGRSEELEGELAKLREENEKLVDALNEIKEAQRKALIDEINELRERLSLPKEEFAGVDDKVLRMLKADYERVIKQAEALKGPKAKYEGKKADDLIEDVREALFGYRKR